MVCVDLIFGGFIYIDVSYKIGKITREYKQYKKQETRDTITNPHINHNPPFKQSQHVTVQKRLEFKLSMTCHQPVSKRGVA